MTPTVENFTPPNRLHPEAAIAKTMAHERANRNSDTFLWASIFSVALSLGLQAAGQKDKANFVAHWAPTLLLFGVYDRIVNTRSA
jgi:hypothetical protein